MSLRILFFLSFFVGTAHAAPQWFVVELDGAKVGQAQMHREIVGGRTVDVSRIALELQGADRPNGIELEQRFESAADGSPFAYSLRLATHDMTRVQTAAVDGDAIDVQVDTHGVVQQRRIALPAGVTWPLAEAALLRAAFAQPGRMLAFRGFDTSSGRAVDVELRIGERRAVAALDGEAVATEVVRTTRDGDRRATSTSWLDANLVPLRVEMDVAGMRLHLVAATRAQADAPNRPLDFVKRLYVRSPYRIPPAATAQRIRYVLAHDDRAIELPATGEQRVRRDGDALRLDICATCGDEAPLASAPDEALQPGERIESDAPEIVAAARAVGGIADPRRRMLALADHVRGSMQGINGYLGRGTALQAARSGRGDCVAYALYLAALGRAAGIPTRVAAGMVYSAQQAGRSDVFAPHAWTQALIDGRWVSFDAATAGFDSGHVALVVGQGEPARFAEAMGMLAKLRIRSIAQVAQRADAR